MAVLRTQVGVTLLIVLTMLRSTVDEVASRAFPDTQVESTVGRLLVASPDLEDPNFRHTVVYMIQHDEQGAMGLVINRVIAEGPLEKLLETLDRAPAVATQAEIRIHYGGPVEQGRGFVLHSPEYHVEDTLMLSKFAALTPSLQVLDDIANGKGPAQSLFALGYAGWAAHQLEDEIAAGAWVIVDADEALLFDPEMEQKWQHALDRQGVDL